MFGDQTIERAEVIVRVGTDRQRLVASASLRDDVHRHVAQPDRTRRRHEIGLEPRIVVDVRLGELGEVAIGAALLVEGLLQQPRFVEPVEPARVRAGAAVRRDFVMLDALRDADDRCIARVFCRRLIQTFVGFLNDP